DGWHAAHALAGTRKHSQACPDSRGRIQSVAGDAAVAGQGHAAGSAGTLSRLSTDFIAFLDRGPGSNRTRMRIGPDDRAFTRDAHRNFYPARDRLNKPLLPRAARRD